MSHNAPQVHAANYKNILRYFSLIEVWATVNASAIQLIESSFSINFVFSRSYVGSF